VGSKSARSDGVNSPIYQSKVLGEFPDLSDDTLILPKWIEAAQKRSVKRTKRPIIAADIARFREDETVIMRREGGWVRTCRAHHRADTMRTTGHITKAMRDIDARTDKNDSVTGIVDVVGVGAGEYDRLIELGSRVTAYNRGIGTVRQRALRQRSG
jgi:phage terminase large subunit